MNGPASGEDLGRETRETTDQQVHHTETTTEKGGDPGGSPPFDLLEPVGPVGPAGRCSGYRPAMTAPLTRGETRASRTSAVAALTAAELSSIVDLVVWVDEVEGARVAHAASHLGTVRLRPGGIHEVLSGTDPIGS